MKFVPYICCGDPDLEFTCKLVKTFAPYSYLIELGIPFSDPIADGKTIQKAANRSLKNRTNIEKIFSMVERLRREKVTTPFVFMSYYNIIYSYGKEKFLSKMKEIEVQGIIIPDLPFGEDLEFEKLARTYNISIINLIAPNTRLERAKKILNVPSFFTYLVSVAGTTGARGQVSKESLEFVKRIKKMAGNANITQLFVGFGISNPEQAKQFIEAGADGVIVGSEIINIYSKYLEHGQSLERSLDDLKRFAKRMFEI